MQTVAKAALVVAGLVLVGWIAWWLLKAVFFLLFYVLIGALVVGGVWAIAKFSGKSLPGPKRNRLPRS